MLRILWLIVWVTVGETFYDDYNWYTTEDEIVKRSGCATGNVRRVDSCNSCICRKGEWFCENKECGDPFGGLSLSHQQELDADCEVGQQKKFKCHQCVCHDIGWRCTQLQKRRCRMRSGDEKLYKPACKEGTGRKIDSCNYCLCLNGQEVCTKKLCAHSYVGLLRSHHHPRECHRFETKYDDCNHCECRVAHWLCTKKNCNAPASEIGDGDIESGSGEKPWYLEPCKEWQQRRIDSCNRCFCKNNQWYCRNRVCKHPKPFINVNNIEDPKITKIIEHHRHPEVPDSTDHHKHPKDPDSTDHHRYPEVPDSADHHRHPEILDSTDHHRHPEVPDSTEHHKHPTDPDSTDHHKHPKDHDSTHHYKHPKDPHGTHHHRHPEVPDSTDHHKHPKDPDSTHHHRHHKDPHSTHHQHGSTEHHHRHSTASDGTGHHEHSKDFTWHRVHAKLLVKNTENDEHRKIPDGTENYENPNNQDIIEKENDYDNIDGDYNIEGLEKHVLRRRRECASWETKYIDCNHCECNVFRWVCTRKICDSTKSPTQNEIELGSEENDNYWYLKPCKRFGKRKIDSCNRCVCLNEQWYCRNQVCKPENTEHHKHPKVPDSFEHEIHPKVPDSTEHHRHPKHPDSTEHHKHPKHPNSTEHHKHPKHPDSTEHDRHPKVPDSTEHHRHPKHPDNKEHHKHPKVPDSTDHPKVPDSSEHYKHPKHLDSTEYHKHPKVPDSSEHHKHPKHPDSTEQHRHPKVSDSTEHDIHPKVPDSTEHHRHPKDHDSTHHHKHPKDPHGTHHHRHPEVPDSTDHHRHPDVPDSTDHPKVPDSLEHHKHPKHPDSTEHHRHPKVPHSTEHHRHPEVYGSTVHPAFYDSTENQDRAHEMLYKKNTENRRYPMIPDSTKNNVYQKIHSIIEKTHDYDYGDKDYNFENVVKLHLDGTQCVRGTERKIDSCNSCLCLNRQWYCEDKECLDQFDGLPLINQRSLPPDCKAGMKKKFKCYNCFCSSADGWKCRLKRKKSCGYSRTQDDLILRSNDTQQNHECEIGQRRRFGLCNYCWCTYDRKWLCSNHSCPDVLRVRRYKRTTTKCVEGDIIRLNDGCNYCVCQNGQEFCTDRACLVDDLSATEQITGCNDGEVTSARDRCNLCVCLQGKVTCTKKDCSSKGRVGKYSQGQYYLYKSNRKPTNYASRFKKQKLMQGSKQKCIPGKYYIPEDDNDKCPNNCICDTHELLCTHRKCNGRDDEIAPLSWLHKPHKHRNAKQLLKQEICVENQALPSDDPCNSCICLNGRKVCTIIACADVDDSYEANLLNKGSKGNKGNMERKKSGSFCEPFTFFSPDNNRFCRNCFCLHNGLALCLLNLCKYSKDIPQHLPSGELNEICRPGEIGYPTKCITCTCSDAGRWTCTREELALCNERDCDEKDEFQMGFFPYYAGCKCSIKEWFCSIQTETCRGNATCPLGAFIHNPRQQCSICLCGGYEEGSHMCFTEAKCVRQVLSHLKD